MNEHAVNAGVTRLEDLKLCPLCKSADLTDVGCSICRRSKEAHFTEDTKNPAAHRIVSHRYVRHAHCEMCGLGFDVP